MKTLNITSSVGPLWEVTPTSDSIWAGCPFEDYCTEAIELATNESVDVKMDFNQVKLLINKDSSVADLEKLYRSEAEIGIEAWCKSRGGRACQVEDVVNYVVEEGEASGVKQTPETVRAVFMNSIALAGVRYITITEEEILAACEEILEQESKLAHRQSQEMSCTS